MILSTNSIIEWQDSSKTRVITLLIAEELPLDVCFENVCCLFIYCRLSVTFSVMLGWKLWCWAKRSQQQWIGKEPLRGTYIFSFLFLVFYKPEINCCADWTDVYMQISKAVADTRWEHCPVRTSRLKTKDSKYPQFSSLRSSKASFTDYYEYWMALAYLLKPLVCSADFIKK